MSDTQSQQAFMRSIFDQIKVDHDGLLSLVHRYGGSVSFRPETDSILPVPVEGLDQPLEVFFTRDEDDDDILCCSFDGWCKERYVDEALGRLEDDTQHDFRISEFYGRIEWPSDFRRCSEKDYMDVIGEMGVIMRTALEAAEEHYRTGTPAGRSKAAAPSL